MVTAMKLQSTELSRAAAISCVVRYALVVGNFSATSGLRVVESNFRRCKYYSSVNFWHLRNSLYLTTAQFLGLAGCTTTGNTF